MSIILQKQGSEPKPQDAVELRKAQVVEFYQLVCETWQPQSEIWGLTYGPRALGVAGALSGIYGSMYFRRKLRLRNYGMVSTYLPNAVLPFLIVQTFHQMVISLFHHFELLAEYFES